MGRKEESNWEKVRKNKEYDQNMWLLNLKKITEIWSLFRFLVSIDTIFREGNPWIKNINSSTGKRSQQIIILPSAHSTLFDSGILLHKAACLAVGLSDIFKVESTNFQDLW